MRKVLIFLLLLSFFTVSAAEKDDRVVYNKLGLKNRLSYKIFKYALQGHREFISRRKVINHNIITIVDYTKPSTEKRFFVIDISKRKLLFEEFVAHGKKTGENRALYFSDKPGSLQSSPGFFITGGTYYGKHGYSLKLKGMEKGINNNAEKRAVVMHGAWYVSDEFLKKYGRLGRSWGCPALDRKVVGKVIDKIKSGTTLFVYAGEKWVRKSELLNKL